MADSASSSDPLERYGAIERAYCEERWMAVIHDGQTLLGDLGRSVEVPPEGLKERLQLLIGHAFLYGLGDRDSAEDLYQAVLRSGAEASLRQIAEQGLQQCTLPVATAEAGDEPQQQGSPDSELAVSPPADTSGWLETGTAELPAEVAIPPQSDSAAWLQGESAATQAPDDSWPMSVPQVPPAETAALSWLNTPAAATPDDSAAQPVMPWLASGAAPAAVPVTPESIASEQSQQAFDVAAQDRVAGTELPQPGGGLLSSQQDEAWAQPSGASLQMEPESLGSAPADVGAVAAEPLAADREAAAAWSPEGLASPEAIAADIAAVFQPESGRAPVGSGSGAAAPLGRVQDPADSSGSLDAAAIHSDSVDSLSASSELSPVEERLVPDVVDEPELIELRQAASQGEEELLLPIHDQQSQQPPVVVGIEAATPAAVEPLRRSELDRPDKEPEARGPQLRLVQPAAESGPVAMATGSTSPPALPAGPFSTPPEPVAEEDSELLMGLLKVEMG